MICTLELAVSNLELPVSNVSTATMQSETGDALGADSRDTAPQELVQLRQRLDFLKNLYDIKDQVGFCV